MVPGNEIELRAARPDDAAAIVTLIREGFEPGLLELTIYGCDNVERYVRVLVEGRQRGVDTTFVVAADGETPVGAAEMRRLGERQFLNYVAVTPELRARGLGSALLGAAIEVARRPGQRTIELDVLAGNEVARAWYRGLGFADSSVTEWWTLAPPAPDRSSPAPVAGWAQAVASQRAFGFSEVSVAGKEHAYRIGLLGHDWFRLADAAALAEPALGATLAALDPERSLLALVPPGTLAEPLAQQRATMIRMWAGLDAVARRIAEREA